MISADDWFEIAQVTYRYSHAMDARRWELMDDVFLPDATIVLGDDTVEGRDNGVAAIRSFIETCSATHHVNSNLLVLDAREDRVTATCNFHAWHKGAGPTADQVLECLGTYVDEFVRTADGWRISRREEAVTGITQGDIERFFAHVAV